MSTKEIVELVIKPCSSCDENIGFITINNPPVNSLSINLVQSIDNLVDNISKELKVLVFKSQGKGFCAGADLKERASMGDDETIKVVDSYKSLFSKIYKLPCPTIAAIQGYAIGGGLEFALACDFRFSTADSVFSFPETSLGIIPGAGGTQRLSRLIGLSKAKKWIFTADKFTAKQALRDSVIDKVFDDQDLMTRHIEEFSCKIARNSQRAVSSAKKSINYTSNHSLAEGLNFEREEYLKTLNDPLRIEKLKEFKK